MRLLLVSSLLLFACRQGKNSEALQDVDGDGFTPSDGDCDDADAAIFPNAEELCDGVDNDCDEEIDEEAGTLYYPDSDEDGYGPEELAEYHCEEPEGLVSQGGDCDDEDAAINPGATEVCDGLDNDCNEVIDDDTAEDASLWFEDADADGYGNPDVVLSACDAPAGYVEDGFDCDDDNPDLNPGALDIPNDSIDQDCTGSDAQALTMEEISVGDLILSELMIDPLAVEDYKGEWFELHNASVEGMDLNGLVIGSQITSFIVEEHIVIAPNAYVLFAVRDQLDQNGGMNNVDYVYSRDAIQLDNSGELTLYAPDGLVLDQLSYAAPDFPIQEGVAIVNGLLNADADTGDLWCSATTSYGDGDFGTPGAVNDPCDLDGDGFTPVDGDCDDLNDAIYPTASEYCDGVDNDCDGLVDDEDDNLDVSQLATTFYADADLDGYGDASTTIEACSVPAGYVENDEDCDDGDPTISPDADEICDGIDNDCDGLGDDEDTVISGGNTYYLDSDGDGFGDPDVTGEACTLIEGYSEDFTDCDDTDAMVFVGQREACDDGIDNNCDSAFDGPLCEFNFGNLGSNGIKITNTSPTELAVLGFSLTSLGDVSGDGNPDFAVVSRFADDGGGTSSGSTYVYFGPQTADLGSSDADVILYGGSGEVSGQAVTGAQPILGLGGDHNGDGNNDIAINAIKASGEAGAIYLAQGPLSGTVDLSTSADVMIVGEVAGDQLGRGATSFLGDINGDGNDDLLVGSYKNDFGGTDAGAAYLLLGPVPASGTVSTVAAISLYGSSGDNLGYAVGAAGDVNGDGIADALVNANRMDTQDADGNVVLNAGRTYLFHGSSTPAWSTTSPDASFDGVSQDDKSGVSIASAGDIDGDGTDDIAIGAPTANYSTAADSGAVYVFTNNPTGTFSLGDAAAILYPEEQGGTRADVHLGRSLTAVGDIDQDGHNDLVVGAKKSNQNGSNSGALYIYFGPLSGTYLAPHGVFAGEAAGDEAGIAVAAVGDIDGQGQGDILVGGYKHDGLSGAAYLIFSESFQGL